MRSLKLIVLSVVAALTVFCAIFYTSCSKDNCKAVTCLNYGTCSGGICNCSIPGVGGANCETVYGRLYANTYEGNATDDSGNVYINSKLIFEAPTDTTDFNKMSMRWVDSVAGRTLIFSIVLSNNLSTGSNFTVDTLSADTTVYSGTGSVNGNVASLYLKEVHKNSPTQFVTFSNFNKQ